MATKGQHYSAVIKYEIEPARKGKGRFKPWFVLKLICGHTTRRKALTKNPPKAIVCLRCQPPKPFRIKP